MSPTNIYAPVSTPAESIFGLSIFVFSIVAMTLLSYSLWLAYAVVRFRNQRSFTEPAQIYGSTQVELAWTVIPVLIVVALFLAATRVILAVQNAPHPASALNVIVTGHQYWWEYRYPTVTWRVSACAAALAVLWMTTAALDIRPDARPGYSLRSALPDFLALTKPEVNFLIVIATFTGFYVGFRFHRQR
jgi:heme/copper-type cytochrome/quinol oxidase subunit 2